MTKEERDNLILKMELDSQRVNKFDQLSKKKQSLEGVCLEIDDLTCLQYVGKDKEKVWLASRDELNKKIKNAIIKTIKEEIVLIDEEIEKL